MYISKVSIKNYRNFMNSNFEFVKGINTIIGENGSGKTNLFRAIRLILDDNLYRYAYRLDENDFMELVILMAIKLKKRHVICFFDQEQG